MKKINFNNFRLFTGIDHSRSVLLDVSKDLADLIYTNSSGIMAHDLAFRIFKSNDEIELSEEELNFLSQFVSKNCSPAFIDSVVENLK